MFNLIVNKQPMIHQQIIAENTMPCIHDTSKTGTGKSINFISFANSREYTDDNYFGLIFCVKKARKQFAQEIQDTASGISFVIDRRNQPHLEAIRNFQRQGINVFLISNKEFMNHEPSREYIAEVISIFNNNAIILLDEAHAYRNTKAYWDKNLKKSIFKTLAVRNAITVAHMFKYRYLSTATPYDKTVAEVWVQYHILYPELFDNYYQFKMRYTMKDWYTNKWVNRGSERMKELAELVAPFTYEYKLDDIRDDVPTFTMNYIQVDAPYLVTELAEKLRLKVGDEWEAVIPARKGAFGEDIPAFSTTIYIDHHFGLSSALSKLSSVHGLKKEWLYENHPAPTVDDPILVLCKYRGTATEVAKHYGVTAVMAGVEFTDEIKYANVIVGTIGSLRESVSLQHISKLILIDVDWSSITLRQIMGRVIRLNSEKPITMTVLVSSIIIDPQISAVMNSKLDGVEKYEEISRIYNAPSDENAERLTTAILERKAMKIAERAALGDAIVTEEDATKMRLFREEITQVLNGYDNNNHIYSLTRIE